MDVQQCQMAGHIEGHLKGGADPETGAGFSGFSHKLGTVDAAGNPVCTLVCRDSKCMRWGVAKRVHRMGGAHNVRHK